MRGALVLTTAPDAATARRLARKVLQKKLAACISFSSGWTSSYLWKGRLETSRETLLMIKTTKAKFAPLSRALRAAHPYEVPEIVCMDLSAMDPAYAAWMKGVLK